MARLSSTKCIVSNAMNELVNITMFLVAPEKKKIKPIDVGGLAGGLKFIVQNILFKFAIDYFDLYHSPIPYRR
jgi:hypothetical protein